MKDILSKKFNPNIHLSSNIFLYILVSVYVSLRIINQVSLDISPKLIDILNIINIVFLFLTETILHPKILPKKALTMLLLFTICIINMMPSGFKEVIYLLMFFYSIKSLELKNLLKIIFSTILFDMIIVHFLLEIGIVENSIIWNLNRPRYCLGYKSWTILPFLILSIFNYGILIYENKLNNYYIFMLVIVSYYIMTATGTKTTFIIMLMECISYLILKRIDVNKWGYIAWLIYTPFFFLLFSICFVLYFHNEIFIDTILSFRLSLANEAIRTYGIHFLSNFVKWSIETPMDYLYVDNAFIGILLIWGISGCLLIMGMYSYIISYSINSKNKYLLMITLFTLLIGLFWPRLLLVIDSVPLIYFSRYFANHGRR